VSTIIGHVFFFFLNLKKEKTVIASRMQQLLSFLTIQHSESRYDVGWMLDGRRGPIERGWLGRVFENLKKKLIPSTGTSSVYVTDVKIMRSSVHP